MEERGKHTMRLDSGDIELVDNYPINGARQIGENETILIEKSISSNEKDN